MSNQIAAQPFATEWELLDPVLDVRPLSAGELRKLMGFDNAVIFYGSPPCENFAPRQAAQGEVLP